MYLIELITDRYIGSYVSKKIIGYKETEDDARSYCETKNNEIKGTYSESLALKYYTYTKINLIEN